MKKKILYVGLDVHKKSIDVALANGRVNGKVRSYGKIMDRNQYMYAGLAERR